jgi:hypothetical protein
MNLPHLIALCGHPLSGKSTTQKILRNKYDYDSVDDGFALRKFAVESLGLSWDDVRTQEGKLRHTEIAGVDWENRKILGEFGNAIEATFGPQAIPFIATRNLRDDVNYCFGCVRRDQGRFYRSLGGVVVAIRNPLAPPSKYEFDKFDATLVDYWIENDGLARGLTSEQALLDLTDKIDQMLYWLGLREKHAA